MGETFDLLAQQHYITDPLALQLKKSVGFRNIAVHNYDALNWAIVHSIATKHLQDFTEFAKSVSAPLDQ